MHYACRVMDVLLAKGSVKVINGQATQSCPYQLWYATEHVNAAKYCIFGCPCIAKVYKRTTHKELEGVAQVLTPKNIIQRGVRGIFISLPRHQAGWLVYIPASGKILTSVNVAFDEKFTSLGLAFNRSMFHDAMPVRGQGRQYIDHAKLIAFSGPPLAVPASVYPVEGEVAPDDLPRIYDNEVAFVDEFHIKLKQQESRDTSAIIDYAFDDDGPAMDLVDYDEDQGVLARMSTPAWMSTYPFPALPPNVNIQDAIN